MAKILITIDIPQIPKMVLQKILPSIKDPIVKQMSNIKGVDPKNIKVEAVD